MIIVLVLMGIIVGLSAPAFIRSASAGHENNALGDLVSVLAVHRLEAIQTGHSVTIDVSQSDDQLTLRTGVDEPPTAPREFTAWPLVLVDESQEDVESVEIAFGPRGRSTAERLLFRSATKPTRLWTIAFDPVGGTPTAHRLTETSHP